MYVACTYTYLSVLLTAESHHSLHETVNEQKCLALGGAPLEELLEEASTSPAGSNNSECSTGIIHTQPRYQQSNTSVILPTSSALLKFLWWDSNVAK